MYRGFVLAAVDPGSTPGLGPFAACHSPSLSSCFLSNLHLIYWAIEGQQILKKMLNKVKKQTYQRHKVNKLTWWCCCTATSSLAFLTLATQLLVVLYQNKYSLTMPALKNCELWKSIHLLNGNAQLAGLCSEVQQQVITLSGFKHLFCLLSVYL